MNSCDSCDFLVDGASAPPFEVYRDHNFNSTTREDTALDHGICITRPIRSTTLPDSLALYARFIQDRQFHHCFPQHVARRQFTRILKITIEFHITDTEPPTTRLL